MKFFNFFALVFLIAVFTLNSVDAKRTCVVRATKQQSVSNVIATASATVKQAPKETTVVQAIKEFKDFEMTIRGVLDRSPLVDDDVPEEGAIFIVSGIKQSDFIKKYKVESIKLNSKQVTKILYDEEAEAFRFNSEDYKIDAKNVVEIVLKNIKTSELSVKKFNDVTVRVIE